MAVKKPKAKPTSCLFDEGWANNVTASLDDIYELLEDLLAQADTRASGNTPITDELAVAIMKNSAIARWTDYKVSDSKPQPHERKKRK